MVVTVLKTDELVIKSGATVAVFELDTKAADAAWDKEKDKAVADKRWYDSMISQVLIQVQKAQSANLTPKQVETLKKASDAKIAALSVSAIDCDIP